MSGTNSISNSMLISQTSFTSSISVEGSTANDLAAKLLKNNSQAEGLFERCMNRTASACTSLKNKVVNFASGIKASVSTLCFRLFGLETKTLSERQLDVLKHASTLLITAAQGKTEGLFREGGPMKALSSLKADFSEGKVTNLPKIDIRVVSSFFKSEFSALQLEAGTYKQLINLVSSMGQDEANKGTIAKTVSETFIHSFSEGDAVKMRLMLATLSACYAEAVPAATGGRFTTETFDTIIASGLIPNTVMLEHMRGGSGDVIKANNNAAELLKILMVSLPA